MPIDTPKPVDVEIWSDVVCPFCFIGQQHLRLALAQFKQAHPEVTPTIHWRSFELDPQAPPSDPRSMNEILSQKYGRSASETQSMMANTQAMASAAGLAMNLEGVKRINTFDLHRLLHFAHENGVQDALKAAFMHAYFVDNLDLSQPEVILNQSVSVGLSLADAQAVLASDRYAAEVRADQQLGREYGIQGVPFFVFNQELGVSGAQPVEVLLQALRQSANLA
jgi:predicted DsbA family dithiol-disulfide isomerase